MPSSTPSSTGARCAGSSTSTTARSQGSCGHRSGLCGARPATARTKRPKSASRDGSDIDYNTCPILWGEIGPNAQHAFYQLLHQGTESVMCDFVATARRYVDSGNPELMEQHRLTLANCLAQSRILALGDTVIDEDVTAPYFKRYRGNQPSTTLLLDDLTPHRFGQLIALYEHKVFVQSVIWNINPFDQWGVELGKNMATTLIDPLARKSRGEKFDPSTDGLLASILQRQERQT